ncbi:MAG: hypothetical protein K2P17_00660 [Helicobacteraceae bacterium]|nr:hypothetical protein [Helicobacteraceae bacterium]
MYKKDFDKLLDSKIDNPPQAVFLYGECDFLINFYSKKLKDLHLAKSSLDIFNFYFEEYNAKQIKELLSEQSLFSNSSLVIVKLNKIKDSRKKAKDTEIASFLEILAKNKNNFLIIEFYDDNSSDYARSAKMISTLFNNPNFVFVRFFNPTKNEALEILRQNARSLRLKIADSLLMYLYELQNNQIGICVNELNKFTLINGEISKTNIENLSYGLYTNSIDELCESLLERGDWVKILAKIQEEGVQDIDFIRALQNYFYRLFLFFSFIKSNGRCVSSEILGYTLPKQLEEKYARYAMKLKEIHYLSIFTTLSKWRSNTINGKDKDYFSNLIKLKALIK